MTKAEAFEMWVWRRMEQISWVDKEANVKLYRTWKKNRSILNTVRTKQLFPGTKDYFYKLGKHQFFDKRVRDKRVSKTVVICKCKIKHLQKRFRGGYIQNKTIFTTFLRTRHSYGKSTALKHFCKCFSTKHFRNIFRGGYMQNKTLKHFYNIFANVILYM